MPVRPFEIACRNTLVVELTNEECPGSVLVAEYPAPKIYGVNTPVTAYAVIDSLASGVVVAMRPTHRRAVNACRKMGPHGRYWVTPAYLCKASQLFG